MGQIIAVVSGKGGTGKTSICAGIATALASAGEQVLCIDCDVGLRNLDISLGLSQMDALSFLDVCRGEYDICHAAAHPDFPELFFLTAPIHCQPEEIRAEGKWLHHCVGGYAGRHIEGKLTICFMRSVTDPGTPYVTIEMQGDKIIQAHGYKNDVGKEGPRTVHKEFFDTWLAWVKAGSPRKKDGTPKIKKKKETCVA